MGGVPPDAEQGKELFKMIPEAFLFTYAGSDKSATELNYGPNPNLQPPSREARVFHQLQGEMGVDATQRRLIRMSGQLIADVKFGGAHLLVLVFPPITQLWVPRPCVLCKGGHRCCRCVLFRNREALLSSLRDSIPFLAPTQDLRPGLSYALDPRLGRHGLP